MFLVVVRSEGQVEDGVGKAGGGIGVGDPAGEAVGGTALEEELRSLGRAALGVGPGGEGVAAVDAAGEEARFEERAEEDFAVVAAPEFGADAGAAIEELFERGLEVGGAFGAERAESGTGEELGEFGELGGLAPGDVEAGVGTGGEADGGGGAPGGSTGGGVTVGAAAGAEGEAALEEAELLVGVGAGAGGGGVVLIDAGDGGGDAVEVAVVMDAAEVGAEERGRVFAGLPGVVGVPDPFPVAAGANRGGVFVAVFEGFVDEGDVLLEEEAGARGGAETGGEDRRAACSPRAS